MSEHEDLELEALQRKLDDAFETTRPRRGFEDELWLRMQSGRPLWQRIRDALAGLAGGMWEAPAVPLGVLAVVLIVVIGAGVLLQGGLHQGSAPSLATAGKGQYGPNAATQFGRVPTPAFHPGLVDRGTQGADMAAPAPNPSAAPAADLYFGPAILTWSGRSLNGYPVSAPVLRYVEPTKADADRFAASLGVTSNQTAPPGYLSGYAGPDFNLTLRSTVPQLPREPFFVITPVGTAAAAGTDPRDIANAFLAAHNLTPTWPYVMVVVQSGDQTRVRYERGVQVPGFGVSYMLDWNGEPYGIEVDIKGTNVTAASGTIPLGFDVSTYPLISNDQAVREALASAPASTQEIKPTPVVTLDRVDLVYVLAVSGRYGYYVPCYEFSGTFQYNGRTYVKRVLVPLVQG